SAVAPGCSQSWATGLMPREFFATFELIVTRLDVRALGLYEVSPPLDQDDRTSKLAAQIAHHYIFATGTSK
ncbi:MAG: arginase family protein, partial [Bdellovibrionota bacterium]